MLLPAIPDIIEEFDISYNTSSWILSAYLIAGAVATPLGGKLSDIYGRKKMVIIILIIYIIGITLGGLSTNISFLIVARVIQGIGISMFPIAFGIIRDQFPKDKLAIGVGVFKLYVRGWFCGWSSIGSEYNREFWLANYVFSIVFVAIGLWFIIRRYIHDEQESVNAIESPEIHYSSDTVDNKINDPDEETTTSTSKKNIDMRCMVTLAITIISLLMVLSYSHTDNIEIYQIGMFLFIGITSLVLL